MKGVFVWTAALTLLWSSVSASADVAGSREAFAKMDYVKVVSSYDGVNATDMNDRALYRYAISLHRVGRSVEALEKLKLAEAANPSGSFASSPQRLALWRTEIGVAAASARPAVVTPVVTQPAVIAPTATASVAALGTVVSEVTVAVAPSAEVVLPQPVAVEAPPINTATVPATLAPKKTKAEQEQSPFVLEPLSIVALLISAAGLGFGLGLRRTEPQCAMLHNSPIEDDRSTQALVKPSFLGIEDMPSKSQAARQAIEELMSVMVATDTTQSVLYMRLHEASGALGSEYEPLPSGQSVDVRSIIDITVAEQDAAPTKSPAVKLSDLRGKDLSSLFQERFKQQA